MQQNEQSTKHISSLSPRRIVGFACAQSFVFLLLFAESIYPTFFREGNTEFFASFELLILLGALCAGFAIMAILSPDHRTSFLRRPLLYCYAIVMGFGALFSSIFPGLGAEGTFIQNICIGFPSAFLLTAWGRAFGPATTAKSVPEVFLASLVAAGVCMIFLLLAASPLISLAAAILPFASVFNLDAPFARALQQESSLNEITPIEAAESTEAFSPESTSENDTQKLPFKMLVGTFLFGIASGLLGIFNSTNSLATFSMNVSSPGLVSLIIFAAFLIGCLSLLLSNGFGQGDALSKSYRLAIFLMMLGILLVPLSLLEVVVLPGQIFVAAAFLGLEVIFVALFLVIAELTQRDCASALSLGFLTLFAGEFIGLAINTLVCSDVFVQRNASYDELDAAFSVTALPALDILTMLYVLTAVAGALILLSYIFFFTDRDFSELSQIVNTIDNTEEICASMTARYGLSPRESEILSYALRGRTNERIAQELVIAKSTVDTHMRRIYGKCSVHSRQELLDLRDTWRD